MNKYFNHIIVGACILFVALMVYNTVKSDNISPDNIPPEKHQIWYYVDGDIENPFETVKTNLCAVRNVSNGYVQYVMFEILSNGKLDNVFLTSAKIKSFKNVFNKLPE